MEKTLHYLSFLVLVVLACACGTKKGDSTAETIDETAGTTGERSPDIKGEEVTYEADGISMKGFIAYDANQTGERPGVLVVHEWWGHNEYTRKRATMLAELGYVALAVDMYGDGLQADHPEDAGKFSSAVFQNIEGAKARFTKAMETLKDQAATDPDKIAAIGYCFGGGVVLHMARFGFPLNGVVSFHGSLGTATPAAPGDIKAAILVCHGADDPFISPESLEGFKKEMNEAGADLTFKSYEGAMHAFTNPDADEVGQKFEIPLAYDEAADKASWNEMQKFFEKIFSN